MNAIFNVNPPQNEKIKEYRPNSDEIRSIKQQLKSLKGVEIEIPLIINGQEVRTGNMGKCIMPHEKGHVLATYHKAGPKEVKMAIEAAMAAKNKWESTPWEQRVAVFLKAAELLSGPKRDLINAATMLCQSKTVMQAEIDSACEFIDFLRFNASYIAEIYNEQPGSTANDWNRVEYRSLDGFVFAVTPFNFTSIAGNLCAAPAIAGNTVIWKPAQTAVYSNYFVMKLFMEAGLPAGVINFLPGDSSEIGDMIIKDENLGGIHFTGSTDVFRHMWKTVGENIASYKAYPRLVGETGGKDFVFVEKSADTDAAVTALIRGAFEFQGQKCSAASRAYIPEELWTLIKEKLVGQTKSISIGDVEDTKNFVGAVIDKKAFDKISEYIEFARNSNEAEIIAGGKCDDAKGFFIEPTIIVTTNPNFKTMTEEIFGPVLTIYIYKADEIDHALKLCIESTGYALTGAIFAQDRYAINILQDKLCHAAGNFYINDKPTGAVVGQQPFGGSKLSGTNDKAGSKLNLLRWVSARTIKENFNPPKNYRYPFME